MTQRNAQTIAYPADRAEAPYTNIPQELTGREWLHSVLPGIGLAVAVFCVPPLAQMAIYGTWSAVDLRVALLCGGALTGCLLVVRYVTDVAKLIANQLYIMAVLQREYSRLYGICDQYAAAIDSLRVENRRLRGWLEDAQQPAPAPMAASAPAINEATWDSIGGDPYAGQLPHETEDIAEVDPDHAPVPSQLGEAWAIIDNYTLTGGANGGSISKHSCRDNSGITRAQWERGIALLGRAGAVTDSATGNVLAAEPNEAKQIVEDFWNSRSDTKRARGPQFTPA